MASRTLTTTEPLHGRGRVPRAGRLLMAALCFSLLGAVALSGPAGERAAAQGASLRLPPSYVAQKIDSPNPVNGGGFGGEFVNAGDVDRDGRDDLLVSQQTGEGQAFLISGGTGQLIRRLTPPDASTGGNAARFGLYVAKLGDIGSCAGGQVSQTCPANPSGSPDGVPDFIVSASGVDFGSVVDIGRVYVFDGATGAVLKRIDMPAEDRAAQAAVTPQPRPDFGRSVLVPSSPFPEAAPPAVKIGDLDGGGRPDVVVGASFYYEAGPQTNLSCNPGPCSASGRVYFYRGEDIAGTNPAVVLDQPFKTLKNPRAETDDRDTPFQQPNSELFGFSTIPLGDVGRCNVDPGPSVLCVNASSTTVADGRPDLVVTEPRADFPDGYFDSGIAWLIDGPTGSILARYNHPQPQSASALGLAIYNQPAIGDVGNTAQPDFFLPSMTHHADFIAQGRGWIMNGNFKTTASFVSFSQLDDPTPNQSGNFSSSSAGIGDVAGDPRNELLVGSAGPRFPATDVTIPSDVHVMSPLSGKALLTVDDPDRQPGSGFGSGVAPLGDLNSDGFLDFAAGSAFYDGSTGPDQGRLYIFRSSSRVQRSVTLALSRHVVAQGRVVLAGLSDSPQLARCVAGAPVALTLNGRTVRRTVTKADGSFRQALPDRPGRYEAVAEEVADAGITCSQARSGARLHRHPRSRPSARSR